jgi:hypothetical protein
MKTLHGQQTQDTPRLCFWGMGVGAKQAADNTKQNSLGQLSLCGVVS